MLSVDCRVPTSDIKQAGGWESGAFGNHYVKYAPLKSLLAAAQSAHAASDEGAQLYWAPRLVFLNEVTEALEDAALPFLPTYKKIRAKVCSQLDAMQM